MWWSSSTAIPIRRTRSPVAAGLAALDLYRDEDLFARAKKIEPLWYDAAMTLKGVPRVLDVRCVGLTAGIDLASRPDGVGKRGFEAMERGFHDEGIMFRVVGDSLAVSPPLIVSEAQIGEIFDKIGPRDQSAELNSFLSWPSCPSRTSRNQFPSAQRERGARAAGSPSRPINVRPRGGTAARMAAAPRPRRRRRASRRGIVVGSPLVHTTTAPLVRRSDMSIHGARRGLPSIRLRGCSGA